MTLIERKEFSEYAWRNGERDLTFVRKVTLFVKEELRLPNDCLLPEDALFEVLVSDDDDMPVTWVRIGLKVKLGITVSHNTFVKMHEEGTWTVGRFVDMLYACVKQKPCDSA